MRAIWNTRNCSRGMMIHDVESECWWIICMCMRRAPFGILRFVDELQAAVCQQVYGSSTFLMHSPTGTFDQDLYLPPASSCRKARSRRSCSSNNSLCCSLGTGKISLRIDDEDLDMLHGTYIYHKLRRRAWQGDTHSSSSQHHLHWNQTTMVPHLANPINLYLRESTSFTYFIMTRLFPDDLGDTNKVHAT